MLLLVRVVDRADHPLPSVRFFAWSDSGATRYPCLTNEQGVCVRFVRPGDHGRLELPWHYRSWVEGAGQWANDPDCPRWSVGSLSHVVADMSSVIRVRFVDTDQSPIRSFRWSYHNDGMRTAATPRDANFGEPADDIAYLYGKDSVPAGSVLFVKPVGASERFAIADEDLSAEQGIHTLQLKAVQARSLRMRLAASFPPKAGEWFSFRMQSKSRDPVPKSYFIAAFRTDGSQEILVRDVLPGEYELRLVGSPSPPTPLRCLETASEEWSITIE